MLHEGDRVRKWEVGIRGGDCALRLKTLGFGFGRRGNIVVGLLHEVDRVRKWEVGIQGGDCALKCELKILGFGRQEAV